MFSWNLKSSCDLALNPMKLETVVSAGMAPNCGT